MRPTLTEVEAELARRSLRAYVEMAWHVAEPGRPFVPGFHIDAICEHLEAVAAGEIPLLVINMPPRHGKSLLGSVFFPTWAWTWRPELRFLYASYSQSLSVRDSVASRRLIESSFYRARFGGMFRLTSDQNLKARFDNDRGGMRIATSIGGSATGEGGDILVVDDPHKIEEAGSDLIREGVIEFFDTTLTTRLNDPSRGGIVVIAQRLHERDLPGHLIEREECTHLCLPAEWDPEHPRRWAADPRTRPGEPLWPARYGSPEIERIKRSLGSQAAAGQLQQLPAPAGGGIFRREWWNYYDPAAPPARVDRIVQSWDLSFSGGTGSDFVVGQLWAQVGAEKYLLRQFRAQADIVETIAAIRDMTAWADEAHPDQRGHAILVEQAANGQAVIDMLGREVSSVIGVVPRGDKVSRAQAVLPQIEAGNVHLPGARSADGKGYDRTLTPGRVGGLIEEAAAFPRGAHDDQVDAAVQALTRLSEREPRIWVL